MQNSERKGTLGFIIQKNKILLALIEYPDGKRLWNGIGGYAEAGETLEDALIREFNEETYVNISKANLKKVAELNDSFQLNVFIINLWNGELKIKDRTLKELKWFSYEEIPYNQMHQG